MKPMHEDYREEGFDIVAITLSRTSKDWIVNWKAEHDVDYTFLMCEEGDTVARDLFKVSLQGYVCIVDEDGMIRHVIDSWIGDDSVQTYERLVASLIND